MGIDGWIYIAVGDYGFTKATGKDGRELQLHGGGVVRVRPDGTELEIVSRGQRNIYDVAIDPLMNIFTRDNTNDGDGWDVRLSQITPFGNYGYPTLFTYFGEEIIQPLLDTGGGSPTGALFLSEPGFPGETGQSLLTCEWGRSAIHRHPLSANGSTFKATEAPFITIDRPTDIDVDGQGRLYVSSWRNGGFTFSGANVGFIARVVPEKYKPEAFPDLPKASAAELLKQMTSASHVRRFATQREILGRGPTKELTLGLEKLMQNKDPLPVRVAALFTYNQLLGAKARQFLVALADDAEVREFALKAMVDRQAEMADLPISLFEKGLQDTNPCVRLQAVIGLRRLGKKELSPAILPLLADADPVVAHIACQVLIAFRAIDTCLTALNQDNAKIVTGALRVLQSLHDAKVVDGLLSHFDQSNSQRQAIFRTLCRLHYKEADWDGKWWGTRPDIRGPYFNPVAWSETPRIHEHLKKALSAAGPDDVIAMAGELNRHRVDMPEATTALLKIGALAEKRLAVVEVLAARKPLPADAIPFLAEIVSAPRQDKDEDIGVRAKALKALYRGGAGQEKALAAALQGFALVRDNNEPTELADLFKAFIRDNSHSKRLDLFVKAVQSPQPRERELALTVLMNLAGSKIANEKVKNAAMQAVDLSMKNSESALSFLNAIRKTRSEEYAFQVLNLTKSTQPEVQNEASALVKMLNLDRPRQDRKDAIKYLKYEDVLAAAQKEPGDAAQGARLFAKQGCAACHTITKSEPPKGPYLGDIANRYKRPELIESILKPSAKIAQGFETKVFVMSSGKTLNGFVVREAGDEV
jgi:cytochrome c551/c552